MCICLKEIFLLLLDLSVITLHMSKIIIFSNILFTDTQSSIGFSNCQEKEIHEGTMKRFALLLVDAFLFLCCFELTLVFSYLLGLQVHH